MNLCGKDALNIRLTAMPFHFTRLLLPVFIFLLFLASCSTITEKKEVCLELECQDSALYHVLGREFGYTWQWRTSGETAISFIDWGSCQWLEKQVVDSFDTVYFSQGDTCVQMGLLARDEGYANQYFQSLERALLSDDEGIQKWKFWHLNDSLSYWIVDLQVSEKSSWPQFNFLGGIPVGVKGRRGAHEFSYQPSNACAEVAIDTVDCVEAELNLLEMFPNQYFTGTNLELRGKVMLMADNEQRSPIPDAQVEIVREGQVLSVVHVNDSGRYDIELPLDYLYLLNYSAEGMVHKSIEIDTRYMPLNVQSGGFAMDIDMSLFEAIPGVDFSILDQPIGKCKYDEDSNAIEFDFDYTRMIQDSVSVLLSLQTH